MNKILKKKGFAQITIDQYREMFSFPVKGYYEKLGFDFKNDSFEKEGLEFIEEYKKHRYDAQLYPGVVKLLEILRQKGIGNSILSAQHQILLNDLICYYKINKKFINIVGLDNHYAHSKIENGVKLIKSINVDNKNILMVGDTDHDYQVAEAIGIDCILLSHGHNSAERLKQTSATIFENLSELKNFVKNDYSI
jgi:phosphoglycolate phosphatase